MTFEAARVLSNAEGLARVAATRTGEAVTAVVTPLEPRADSLRPAIASLLGRMARRAEEALVIDIDLEGEIMVMRRRLAAAAAPAALAARRAVALEGLLAVDASVALTRLFERRFATLLRLRMRSNTPELLPDGRPFLDLGRALREVAEAWR